MSMLDAVLKKINVTLQKARSETTTGVISDFYMNIELH